MKLIGRIKNDTNVEENKSALIDLWRGLDCEGQPNENSLSEAFKGSYKHTEQTVLYLLVQFLSTNNCFDVLEEFQREFEGSKQNVCYLKNVIRDNLQFRDIMDDINNGRYESLEGFIKGSKVSQTLMFYFSIYKFVTTTSERASLCVLTGEIAQYLKTMVGECKKFLRLLVFKENVLEMKTYVENVLKELFVIEYSKNKLFNNHNYLPDILYVGSTAFDQLKKASFTVIDKEDNTLPVEIKLPKGFNYHSLFVCPVLKTLCVDDNKPVLLNCNHVISLNAANVLSKFGASENFKCPYCPEMCSYKSLLVLDL